VVSTSAPTAAASYMSSRHDPVQVLRHLADTLDVELTLAAFPGMTREKLAEIIRNTAAGGRRSRLTGVLSVDGAARGNPGQAGAGIVLKAGDGSTHHFGVYLGEATNNVAEYKALLLGMQKAAELGFTELKVRSDSELIIKQLNGLYKVKNPQLQDLYFTVVKTASSFDKVTFTHVPREENREADRMANMAIDAKGSVSI
jgi:ribonuclease HI